MLERFAPWKIFPIDVMNPELVILLVKLGASLVEALRSSGVSHIMVEGQEIDLESLRVDSVSERLRRAGVTPEQVAKILKGEDLK